MQYLRQLHTSFATTAMLYGTCLSLACRLGNISYPDVDRKNANALSLIAAVDFATVYEHHRLRIV
jgi:hypothetical protein